MLLYKIGSNATAILAPKDKAAIWTLFSNLVRGIIDAIFFWKFIISQTQPFILLFTDLNSRFFYRCLHMHLYRSPFPLTTRLFTFFNLTVMMRLLNSDTYYCAFSNNSQIFLYKTTISALYRDYTKKLHSCSLALHKEDTFTTD